jgi:Rieske 2Fe-2S family protein
MRLLEDPASFTTLPRSFYLDDPVLFEAEMERVWYRQWLYLAHESEIPEPGDYVIRRLVGESVIVVRTESGEVAALLNVCRHRGARIVDEPCGRLKRFVCPYHQWTYELGGGLKAAPSMPDGEAVDHGSLGMIQLPLETWQGLLFGCLGETAPASLAGEIASLAPFLADYRPARMRPIERRSYSCRANWKVMLENYLECYHCAGSHPEFCITADPRVRGTDEFNQQAYDEHPYWGMDVPLRRGTSSASRSGDYVCAVRLGDGHERGLHRARSFGTWSASAVVYFYADHAMVHQLAPVSATLSEFHLTWFVDESATDADFDVDEVAHVWDMTTRQDVELIERTQDGLGSRRYTPGPLSAKHEPYIRSSLNIYLAMMAGDPRVAELLPLKPR